MDWDTISARQGRNDLPALLARAVLFDKVLTDRDEIVKGIRSAWTMAEWPTRSVDKDLWIMLFKEVLGEGEYLEETEIRPQDSLPDITLYRGAAEGYENGLSWTADFDKAVWFANRFRSAFGETIVLELEIPKYAVLAHFDKIRGEDEYVVYLESAGREYTIKEAGR